MKKRKIVIQIKIGNGKTIDDFVKFNNNFMSTHAVRAIKGIKISDGIEYIIYYNKEAEEYVKELKEEGFKLTVD